MNLSALSIKRPITVYMCTVAVLIFGTVSFTRLGIDLLPEIAYPSLTIQTELSGGAPAEIENLLTRRIEEAVGVISGVRRISSYSRPGLSQVDLEFGWGTDMNFAAYEVRDKLDVVQLPEDAQRPRVLRFNPSEDPILRLGLVGSGDLVWLRRFAEEQLKKDLETAEGVAAVKVTGGHEEEIQVDLDEGRLAELGITIQEVGDRLAQDNVNLAGGSIFRDQARYLVRTVNELETLDDIRKTIVKASGSRKIRLADIAQVRRGHKERDTITRVDGVECVDLSIYKEGDRNTVAVAEAVRRRLDEIDLPEGLEVITLADQSRFIRSAVGEVINNALFGGLIAVLVLYLFLRDFRSTLSIAISIPVSIVATFFLMYRLGISMNIMSLGGLALGVGMLVDNSIVVLESIHRHRGAMSARDAAAAGASEVGMAVTASTLTTAAVFLPIVFVVGVAGQLFRDQALTVTFSLLASLVVSLTLIPTILSAGGESEDRDGGAPRLQTSGSPSRLERGLASLVRVPRRAFRAVLLGVSYLLFPLLWLHGKAYGAIERSYPRILRRALEHRGATLFSAALVFALSLVQAQRLGLSLIPSFTQGEFSFRITLPEGTPLATTDSLFGRIEDAAAGAPNIDAFSVTVGTLKLSGYESREKKENIGRLSVRVKDASREEETIAAIRRRLAELGGIDYRLERPTFFSFKTPIEVEIYGNDLDELREVSAEVAEALSRIPALTDVQSTSDEGSPEVRVVFDQGKLSGMGVEFSDAADALRHKIQGRVATRITEGERVIDVNVRTRRDQTGSVQAVDDLMVARGPGGPIRLKSVAGLRIETGAAEIQRIGQRRCSVVSAGMSGTDLGAVARQVEQALSTVQARPGVVVRLSGQTREMDESLSSLLFALGLAAFLVYLVMASQFESLVQPFVIMFTVPLGLVGVVLALTVTGIPVSVLVLIGTVMLTGIVVNNAIVLVDCINRLRKGGLAVHEAITGACALRLRPILMTAMTTVLGLLPMALGMGEGAELRSSMAVAVIGGLVVATGLTLIVIPTAYSVAVGRRAATRD